MKPWKLPELQETRKKVWAAFDCTENAWPLFTPAVANKSRYLLLSVLWYLQVSRSSHFFDQKGTSLPVGDNVPGQNNPHFVLKKYSASPKGFRKSYALLSGLCRTRLVDNFIHGPLHILVDLVTRGYGEKSTNRVKNPRVGWANSMGRGDGGAVERDEINAWGLLNMLRLVDRSMDGVPIHGTYSPIHGRGGLHESHAKISK